MKKLVWLILLPFFSCTKEQVTYIQAYWMNTTQYQIEIRPINGGVVVAQNIVRLAPGANLEIAATSFRGIINRPMVDSRYFDGADSLVVVYDSLYKITHYSDMPPSVGPKHYLFTSTRNIGNPASYTFDYEDVSKMPEK